MILLMSFPIRDSALKSFCHCFNWSRERKKDIDDLMCFYGTKAALGSFLKEPFADNVNNLFYPVREEAETHIVKNSLDRSLGNISTTC